VYYIAEWVDGWHSISGTFRTLAEARAVLERWRLDKPSARLQVMRDY
jgi:hypothetical protein